MTTSTEQDLVAAFLAKRAVTLCPTRVGRGKSVDWLGWEPDTAEQPVPEAREVRGIARRVKLAQRTRVIRRVKLAQRTRVIRRVKLAQRTRVIRGAF